MEARILPLLALAVAAATGCDRDRAAATATSASAAGSTPAAVRPEPSARICHRHGDCNDLCATFGRCHCDFGDVIASHECEARSEEDCKKSDGCRDEKKCRLAVGRCVAP